MDSSVARARGIYFVYIIVDHFLLRSNQSAKVVLSTKNNGVLFSLKMARTTKNSVCSPFNTFFNLECTLHNLT